MTLIDKTEALRIVMEECYKDREMKLATRIEERLAALPPAKQEHVADSNASGVGVPESVIHRTVLDWIRDDAGVAVKMSVTPDQANALTARILAALTFIDGGAK